MTITPESDKEERMKVAPDRLKKLWERAVRTMRVSCAGSVNFAGQDMSDLLAILDDYGKVKAGAELLRTINRELKREVETLRQVNIALRGGKVAIDKILSRTEKVEAELDATNKAWDIKQQQLEAALAELEAARPLLEAVEKACPEYLQGELMDLRRLRAKHEDEILSEAIPILRAALAHREKKGADR